MANKLTPEAINSMPPERIISDAEIKDFTDNGFSRVKNIIDNVISVDELRLKNKKDKKSKLEIDAGVLIEDIDYAINKFYNMGDFEGVIDKDLLEVDLLKTYLTKLAENKYVIQKTPDLNCKNRVVLNIRWSENTMIVPYSKKNHIVDGANVKDPIIDRQYTVCTFAEKIVLNNIGLYFLSGLAGAAIGMTAGFIKNYMDRQHT